MCCLLQVCDIVNGTTISRQSHGAVMSCVLVEVRFSTTLERIKMTFSSVIESDEMVESIIEKCCRKLCFN